MMRKWTEQDRKKQAERIREWQPWKKAGVKSEGGKAASRMNALKHGAYSEEIRQIKEYLRDSYALLKAVRQQQRELRAAIARGARRGCKIFRNEGTN